MQLTDWLIQLLLENKLLLLFMVIALGYFLGKINIGGFSLGIAAVLFVGIFFGSLHPEMVLPDFVYALGLLLFVYTIGLRSGASFFASFKRSGLRDNALVVGILVASAVVMQVVGGWLGLKATLLTGLFCGSLTNTPALAAGLDLLKEQNADLSEAALRTLLAEPVIGYSLAYPMGVIAVLVIFQIGMRFFKINMKTEQDATVEVTGVTNEALANANIRITNEEVVGRTIQAIETQYQIDLVVSRRLNALTHKISIPDSTDRVQLNDVITVVGTAAQLERAVAIFGELSTKDLSLDRRTVDNRRIFVSNREVIGKTIDQLQLHERFHATISRIRRGDADLPVHGDMQLEAGDRVRVIAPRENMAAVTKYLGDSYQMLAEVDYISLSIGISLGILVGIVPIPLPNGGTFKLGFAAGSLLVALLLGKVGRTGNIVWTMSYTANLTLRQVGTVFFLAGIGLKAGYSFASTFQTAGFQLILVGFLNTAITAVLAVLLARWFFKMPYNLIMGLVAGLQTQPACLAFANEKDETGAPNISYATVFPTAMIVKIILAQWLIGN